MNKNNKINICPCCSGEVVTCKDCGFEFRLGRIKKESLQKYINNSYKQKDFSNRIKFNYFQTINRIKQIRKKGKLLDVGCGLGDFLEQAAPNFNCVGIDICEHNVEFCKNRGLNVHLTDLESMEGVEEFDVIFHSQTLMYIYDLSRHLKLLRNKLSKNGVLIFELPNKNSWVRLISKKSKKEFYSHNRLYFFRKRDIEKILRDNGLKIISIQPGVPGFALSSKSKMKMTVGLVIEKVLGFMLKVFNVSFNHNIQFYVKRK